MLRTISDTTVPALGFGTWELVGEDCVPGVLAALELGYRHIDTAQVYGNEAQVGEAIESSAVDRDEIFLTTKVWNDAMTSADSIRASVEASLAKLRTDHVDLLLVHWPVHLDRLEANLETLAELAAEGATRHIGVSNFNPTLLRRALAVAPIFADQVEHHAYLAQDELRETCAEADVLFTAYSPLARGALLSDPVVVAIAEERGATPAQVLLRAILDEGDNVAVIPKATARERIAENIGCLEVELTDEDRAALAALDRGERQVDPPFAVWDA